MATTPVFLPGESHGQRSLTSYSPRGCKESDTTEATEHACMLDNHFIIVWSIFIGDKSNGGMTEKDNNGKIYKSLPA